MRPTLVVAKFGREPVAFVKAGKPRFVVLVRVFLPTEPVDKLLHRLFLEVRDIVKGLDDPDPFHKPIVQLVLEDVRQRERLERARAEAPMDVIQLAEIGCVVVPLERFANALGGIVGAGHHDT